MIYSVYDPVSGDFTGDVFSCQESMVMANTPDGLACIAGRHDPGRNRVVMADDGFGNAKAVVASRKPPRPTETDYERWDWDSADDDWVCVLTPAGRLRAVRRSRNRLLEITDDAVRGGLERLILVIAERMGVAVQDDLLRLLTYRQWLRDLPSDPQSAELPLDALLLPDADV
jgi:hypothetical protein